MDISGEILIDANYLKNTNVQKRQIKEYTIEILKRINDELKIAHQEGKQYLITELPIIFNITNMTEKNARREVWCKIIECLKQKNYRVLINPRDDTCLLKITWVSLEDEENIIYQKNIIELHTQKFT